MDRKILLLACVGSVILVTSGITYVAAHSLYETTSSELVCPNWGDQDMRSHHGWMHGDDFDEHHREMHGASWEESLAYCH
ncbi:MAG: hypothetical protein GTN76_04690 [Candidatus Aenigmarchaeota archaeon]|nr:hypothetical protein [Candidatus Aenigmarchaeota archaeon]